MLESDSEEEFHDAVEYLTKLDNDQMDLSTALDDAKIALDLFMNNRFEEARLLMKPWCRQSMYHALGTGVFKFLEAMMTFENEQIEEASRVLEQSVEVCNKFRKKSSVYQTLGKIVRKPNYDQLREEEIHAELCYAECLLLRAALTFVEDENLISFVKGGLKMRSCLNAYRECWHILKHRAWGESKHKHHFESGTRFGFGNYNLMVSMLPQRIMKLLEFIGFTGSREVGLNQLLLGSKLEGSLRQVLCSMALLGYHLFVSYVIGYGDGDLVLSSAIIKQQLLNYPDGVWFQFFKGRLEYVKGHLEEAIVWYNRAWQSQSEWVQFHHLCYWELMWANCCKQEWSSSRDFADLLLHESRWSRAIYGYQKGSFMVMMYDRLSNEEKQELFQLFKDIPSWKQRIAGKSIPMEKFIIKKCSRFFGQGHVLLLPALELMYLWNGFKIVGKDASLVESFYLLVCDTIGIVESNTTSPYYYDNCCLLYLLKGMCLKFIKSKGLAQDSKDCFLHVISKYKDIKEDIYLVPYATYEIGILQWTEGKLETAIATLEHAKNHYKGYALESRLHFRIHSALADLRHGSGTEISMDIHNKSPNNLSRSSLNVS